MVRVVITSADLIYILHRVWHKYHYQNYDHVSCSLFFILRFRGKCPILSICLQSSTLVSLHLTFWRTSRPLSFSPFKTLSKAKVPPTIHKKHPKAVKFSRGQSWLRTEGKKQRRWRCEEGSATGVSSVRAQRWGKEANSTITAPNNNKHYDINMYEESDGHDLWLVNVLARMVQFKVKDSHQKVSPICSFVYSHNRCWCFLMFLHV
jgi:hypothetical protein